MSFFNLITPPTTHDAIRFSKSMAWLTTTDQFYDHLVEGFLRRCFFAKPYVPKDVKGILFKYLESVRIGNMIQLEKRLSFDLAQASAATEN